MGLFNFEAHSYSSTYLTEESITKSCAGKSYPLLGERRIYSMSVVRWGASLFGETERVPDE